MAVAMAMVAMRAVLVVVVPMVEPVEAAHPIGLTSRHTRCMSKCRRGRQMPDHPHLVVQCCQASTCAQVLGRTAELWARGTGTGLAL